MVEHADCVDGSLEIRGRIALGGVLLAQRGLERAALALPLLLALVRLDPRGLRRLPEGLLLLWIELLRLLRRLFLCALLGLAGLDLLYDRFD